jgi:hypothetical protein
VENVKSVKKMKPSIKIIALFTVVFSCSKDINDEVTIATRTSASPYPTNNRPSIVYFNDLSGTEDASLGFKITG